MLGQKLDTNFHSNYLSSVVLFLSSLVFVIFSSLCAGAFEQKRYLCLFLLCWRCLKNRNFRKNSFRLILSKYQCLSTFPIITFKKLKLPFHAFSSRWYKNNISSHHLLKCSRYVRISTWEMVWLHYGRFIFGWSAEVPREFTLLWIKCKRAVLSSS